MMRPRTTGTVTRTSFPGVAGTAPEVRRLTDDEVDATYVALLRVRDVFRAEVSPAIEHVAAELDRRDVAAGMARGVTRRRLAAATA